MALEYTSNTPTAFWEEAFRDFLMHIRVVGGIGVRYVVVRRRM